MRSKVSKSTIRRLGPKPAKYASVWLLCRADEETVREVFIVVLNADELVMVKARGRMENLVSAALRESRGAGGFMSGRADT